MGRNTTLIYRGTWFLAKYNHPHPTILLQNWLVHTTPLCLCHCSRVDFCIYCIVYELSKPILYPLPFRYILHHRARDPAALPARPRLLTSLNSITSPTTFDIRLVFHASATRRFFILRVGYYRPCISRAPSSRSSTPTSSRPVTPCHRPSSFSLHSSQTPYVPVGSLPGSSSMIIFRTRSSLSRVIPTWRRQAKSLSYQ